MLTPRRILLSYSACILLAATAASAQPVIKTNGVRNAAHLAPYGHISAGIASGSLFVLLGTGLGPDTPVQPDSLPLRKELGGSSVRVTTPTAEFDAWPVYVSSTRVIALLPSSAPLGEHVTLPKGSPIRPTKFVVTYRGQASAPVEGDIVVRNFGVFTVSETGTGPAVATNYVSSNDQPMNTIFRPARPGQVVTLWGTGLGPVEGDESAGPLPGAMNFPLVVQVGGQAARVLYQGRSGCCAGVDQLIFEVPQGIDGCYVPLTVQAGNLDRVGEPPPPAGAVNASATIAVSASGGPCSDAFGFSSTDVAALQSRGSLRVGWAWLEKGEDAVVVRAAFAKIDSGSMLGRLGVLGLPSTGWIQATTWSDGFSKGAWYGVESGFPLARPLDAGPNLTLSGPGGDMTLRPAGAGKYAAEAPQFGPGLYTLHNGSGGGDIGSFRTTFTIHEPLVWGNYGSPSQPPAWNSGDPAGFALLYGRQENDVIKNDFRFSVAPAAAGSLMPASLFGNCGVAGGRFGTVEVFQSFGMLSTQRFTAQGLDFGIIGSVLFQSRRRTITN